MTAVPEISVIVPAHNPHQGRLARTLDALRLQVPSSQKWEIVLVDNGSHPEITLREIRDVAPAHLRVVREPKLGLTYARLCGLRETTGPLCAFVDDDNILAPDYLSRATDIFARHPSLGAIGGRIVPEFEQSPAAWQGEFFPLLALRDNGPRAVISEPIASSGGLRRYPAEAAPVGAGMVVRRAALQSWLTRSDACNDRQGDELSSAGDNDLVLSILRDGWQVGYFPELSLTHLIPPRRLEAHYLGRLNRGIQKSWMQVLTRHGINPWPSIPGWTVPLRRAKAWLTHQAWRGDAAHVRWQGACGHFEGRVRALGSRHGTSPTVR